MLPLLLRRRPSPHEVEWQESASLTAPQIPSAGARDRISLVSAWSLVTTAVALLSGAKIPSVRITLPDGAKATEPNSRDWVGTGLVFTSARLGIGDLAQIAD